MLKHLLSQWDEIKILTPCNEVIYRKYPSDKPSIAWSEKQQKHNKNVLPGNLRRCNPEKLSNI